MAVLLEAGRLGDPDVVAGPADGDAVSKATLRLAIEEILREGRERVYYYPAYEMVTDASFDPLEKDNRHTRRDVVVDVMACFERHYCRS